MTADPSIGLSPILPDLQDRYGAHLPVIDWVRRLKCSQCGGRRVDFVLNRGRGDDAHDTPTKNPGGTCNYDSSRCRSWTTSAPRASATNPRPAANVAATQREASIATRRWPPALALVARSLALEWSSLGLGPGPMAMAMVVASPAAPRAARARRASHARSTAAAIPGAGRQPLAITVPES
jgi:hypothetical protein